MCSSAKNESISKLKLNPNKLKIRSSSPISPSNPGPRLRSNPPVTNPESVPQSKPSAKSSIIVPSIQPILDIIDQSGNSIYSQIESLVKFMLVDIKTIITENVTAQIPKIETVITNGNAQIISVISTAFDASVAVITEQVNAITDQEKTDTSSLIATNSQALLAAIKNRLATSDTNIQEIVTAQNNVALNDIKTAITSGNNLIYDQIQNILNDPSNNNPVLPQLTIPDPTKISQVFFDVNQDLYNQIENELNTALSDIQTLINNNVNDNKTGGSDIIEAANTSILAVIRNEVENLGANIQEEVTNVTNDEVLQLTDILNSFSEALKSEINLLIGDLESEIEHIIESVSYNETESIQAAITSNNRNILDQVANIFTTK